MERWDIYDEYRNKKGYQVDKGTPLKKGEYHLVVHVCVFNKKNEMLIQKRRIDKPNWPGMWDFSSGGAAIEGENSNAAAERELQEELAINISLSNVRPIITVYFDDGFDDYYIVDIDDELVDKIKFEKDEIDEIMWASQSIINELIETKSMGILKSFVDVIFDMRKKRGNHI